MCCTQGRLHLLYPRGLSPPIKPSYCSSKPYVKTPSPTSPFLPHPSMWGCSRGLLGLFEHFAHFLQSCLFAVWQLLQYAFHVLPDNLKPPFCACHSTVSGQPSWFSSPLSFFPSFSCFAFVYSAPCAGAHQSVLFLPEFRWFRLEETVEATTC